MASKAGRKNSQVKGPRGGTSTVNKSGMVRTVVFLDPEERRALKVAAAERESSGSEVMRQALRQFLGLD